MDNLVAVIHDDTGAALDDARVLAAFHNVPFTTWRQGDRFISIPESDEPYGHLPDNSIARVVVTTDPDGTVNA